jgi:2-polyprenyl-6-hydroxyphenyl methylase/3-demethylubiquinone-9 3-methyltransferase
MSTQHGEEIAAGSRFSFGENWLRFLREFDESRLYAAEQSLRSMLNAETLEGKRFLDIGSGSGLFSLAARRLGARVHSFDYDPNSVACTRELKRRYFAGDADWTIEEGSVLDRAYLNALGQFDIVYSWGVLHHTGNMDEALTNAASAVGPGGQLWIAIYNDQGLVSRYWTLVKIAYNRNAILRLLLIAVHLPYLYGLRWLIRAFRGRLALQRGMSLWHDMIDWLGGYPFEVARPEEIFQRFRDQGFVLQELRTCGGRMGCNEFVFRRTMSCQP